MAFSSSSSSLLLHFKVSIPHTKNPFHRFSSNYCLVPTKIFPKCCSISSKSSTFFKCYSQRQSTEQKNEETEGKNGYQEQVYDFERLFSNLNQATLKREPGSLSSSIFLVAGTTVGAGILAIPAVTQESGFLASAVVCIVCWIYMVVSGLLIAEVNVKTMCELGSGGVSLVSMVRRTLGNTGVQVACWSYIFIHYALLVAYVARSSDILTTFTGIPLYHYDCRWETATLFSLLLGGICFSGSQRTIGAVNGVLVFGIIASFTVLVVVASGDLHWEALLKANFEAAPQSIPIIALSFVYQNVVPVLCTNLEGDLSKVRSAIVFGTAIPLALFLVWDGVILGTITTLGTEADKIADPQQLLRSTNGIVGPIVDIFSLLAIATSYIGFVLGLSDFLADLLKLPSGPNRPLPYLLTLVPPLILSLLDPEIFFKALDFAGTYGVLVLFGLLPAAMSWSDRYSESTLTPNLPPLVPGGKITLSLVFGGAALVILSEIVENFAHT
uniref:Tyrosine-specific transport protein n=1 Tax=Solanum lycopersicum TaxID=4081 RepID=A0A3Q7J0Y1_SOLLC